ncbi:hypothetical protein A5767_05960 [Rhodococcus sp. 852002-51564_SCH6189132-a]|uniref:hypothetical protein n=1 Tax=Rhodococcus sp. 852002-51564_SCH6189132-a TaxID=1834103 RepID=UPI0007EAC100|nr:hypothetical protein [Rhodococcus sp. 852002-51564_SCH6189132-a]OBA37964.1 hypothetical protein A5767_05960 [Rhodococcus sp. 852002-51564_SCH6189132-a]
MNSVAKKAAVAASGAALLALVVPGVSSAAGPSVSAKAENGAIVVDFDLTRADVDRGVTCVTYVLKPGTVDTADPSGRIDAQPAGTSFSVTNTSTSSALYIKDGAPLQAGPESITDGTYNVFWGCQDASGAQYENIFDASGRPFTGGISVTVGDGGSAPQGESAPQAQSAPQAESAPAPQAESAPAPQAESAPAPQGEAAPQADNVPQAPQSQPEPVDPLQFAIKFLRDLIGAYL